MRYKYSLNSRIKGYVEWQLEHYHDDKKQLEEYKKDLMPSATTSYSPTAGCSGGMSKPTEAAAINIVSNAYILSLERNIKAIEVALSKCDDKDKRLIELVYWRRTHTVVGAAYRLRISKSGAYHRLNNILNIIALELGIAVIAED